MPRKRRPRRGSLAYVRKKALNIVHGMLSYTKIKEAKPQCFFGWKVGMTHVQYIDTSSRFTKDRLVSRPVTVLESPSLFVCALRYYINTSKGLNVAGEKWCEKLPKDVKNVFVGKNKNQISNFDSIRLLACTQPSSSGMKQTTSDLIEIGIGGNADEQSKYGESILGKEINADDMFKQGDYIDVSAVTKGHGYTGPVKRFGIKLQSHKAEQKRRHVGAHGTERPGRLRWTTPQAGQYGFFNRTELNKRILMMGDDASKINIKGGFLDYGLVKGKFILVEGSVPGHVKRLVCMRKAMRTEKTEPVEIKYISLDSKQGARV
ncbi:MAG: 50S ribosomal protein L3 [Candidatus Aenigmatarchaeota archaeon]